MQPNQGGIVQGPDRNWYFFTHHGSGDWAGRAASLLPVHWIDGWPVIGQPDRAGVGTMVWEGRMPVQKPVRQFPQGGDDFAAATLSPVWEWNYQPRTDKWSLAARPGYLRLHAFPGLDGGNLLKVGNVLTQRVVRREDRTGGHGRRPACRPRPLHGAATRRQSRRIHGIGGYRDGGGEALPGSVPGRYLHPPATVAA
jgi:hypothetical protein